MTCAECDRDAVARGRCMKHYQRARRGSTREHLSPGDSDLLQTRIRRTVRLAVLSRAESENISEREAWEQAGKEWADR